MKDARVSGKKQIRFFDHCEFFVIVPFFAWLNGRFFGRQEPSKGLRDPAVVRAVQFSWPGWPRVEKSADTGNVNSARRLVGNVLELDPENPKAIFYTVGFHEEDLLTRHAAKPDPVVHLGSSFPAFSSVKLSAKVRRNPDFVGIQLLIRIPND